MAHARLTVEERRPQFKLFQTSLVLRPRHLAINSTSGKAVRTLHRPPDDFPDTSRSQKSQAELVTSAAACSPVSLELTLNRDLIGISGHFDAEIENDQNDSPRSAVSRDVDDDAGAGDKTVEKDRPLLSVAMGQARCQRNSRRSGRLGGAKLSSHRTAGGRVKKAGHFDVAQLHSQRKGTNGLHPLENNEDCSYRHLHPSRQRLRRQDVRGISLLLSATPIPLYGIREAMEAIPGFSFTTSASLDGIGSHLGRILSHPLVIRKCGRSLRRRRLPNLMIMLLTYPIRTIHARETGYQQNKCSPPGTNNPAFWSWFSDTFSSWLGFPGLPDNAVDGQVVTGPILQVLVTSFSAAREQFLGQVQGNIHHEMEPTFSGPLDDPSTFVASPMSARGGTGDGAVVGRRAIFEAKTRRPAQLLRRVSVAADAWLLFLDKSQRVDFDPEMLAELYI